MYFYSKSSVMELEITGDKSGMFYDIKSRINILEIGQLAYFKQTLTVNNVRDAKTYKFNLPKIETYYRQCMQ